MIQRNIVLPRDQSFFLFGPRQTGKTWLLRSLFPDDTTIFYDLLKSEEYLRLVEHPDLFREEVTARRPQKTHVIIDEVQRIPELLNEVHYLLETGSAPYFVLTGSSARKLKRNKANLLAGRAMTKELFPLTARELGVNFQLSKALKLGTLPAVYLKEKEEDAANILRAYVDTYLKEEIELEAQVRGIGRFTRFLSIAGEENGNILNFSNIAREIGATYHTIQTYFQILEDTLVGRFIFPYLKSARKRVAKRPKFYFFDPGVVRALTKRLPHPLERRSSEFGRAFEHFAILEIIKESKYHNKDRDYFYYRTEGGAEVDMIMEASPEEVTAIEIKSKDAVDSADMRGLYSFSDVCPSAKLYCLCLAPRRRTIGKITILPWQELLEVISR